MTELFACDFSRDELAVLADLLELPSLPGIEPDLPVPAEAKAAAARGLLARAVLVADGVAGTVEITQPYATLLTLVLQAEHAHATAPTVEGGADVVYRTPDADVVITADDGPLVRWAVRRPEPVAAAVPGITATRAGAGVSFTPA